MKTKQQKKESYAKTKERLSKAKITLITTFARAGEKGLSVKEMRGLKKSLKELNAEYVVEKKTLLDRAMHDAKRDLSVFTYQGSIGVIYGLGDEFATAKTYYAFMKKFPVMKLFGGIYGDKVIDESMVVEMAKMPTREVLLGRLVGMLMYPIRGLAVALDQIAKKRQ